MNLRHGVVKGVSMHTVSGSELSSCIRKHFVASRLRYDELVSEACEVVIFGSRAAGVHKPSSDLDVLFITPHKRRISAASLDCVLLFPEEVEHPFWLGSELASHVAAYGKWMKGADEGRNRVRISDRAIARKQRRVASVAENATRRWSRLHPVFHTKYVVTIRRELQRLDLLLDRVAVPPTPTLDSMWSAGQVSSAHLLELAAALPQRFFRVGRAA